MFSRHKAPKEDLDFSRIHATDSSTAVVHRLLRLLPSGFLLLWAIYVSYIACDFHSQYVHAHVNAAKARSDSTEDPKFRNMERNFRYSQIAAWSLVPILLISFALWLATRWSSSLASCGVIFMIWIFTLHAVSWRC